MGAYSMSPYLHSGDEDSSSITSDSDSSSDSELELTPSEVEEQDFEAHLDLLEVSNANDEASEIETAPIFTNAVRLHTQEASPRGKAPFGQYGLLAGDVSRGSSGPGQDPRIFYNIAAPSSAFICGSQGSGKSHSLSCMLENCLTSSVANVLPRPLTGIVFHYDSFASDSGGSPCEAAHLSSSSDVKVRVLCPPTNIGNIERIYRGLKNVTVEELRIKETDLDTSRMLEMMAVSSKNGGMPLYLNVVIRILRDLRIHQQRTGHKFSYGLFKQELAKENLTEAQLGPLQQRLDTLESFMVKNEARSYDMFKNRKDSKLRTASVAKGNDWTPKAGQLTIVDLSCPCVTAESACSLFNICLHLFLEQSSNIGRVVALDEAHKYMTDSAECQTLTEALLATIRLQRHLGARILISTQEPTISPKLLDLCSVTIVHRFTSPDWLDTLKKHLAGASAFSSVDDETDPTEDRSYTGVHALRLTGVDVAKELFSRIVALRTGEALMFAPSAIIGMKSAQGSGSQRGRKDLVRLGNGVLKVRVRKRVTKDGGRSIMAN